MSIAHSPAAGSRSAPVMPAAAAGIRRNARTLVAGFFTSTPRPAADGPATRHRSSTSRVDVSTSRRRPTRARPPPASPPSARCRDADARASRREPRSPTHCRATPSGTRRAANASTLASRPTTASRSPAPFLSPMSSVRIPPIAGQASIRSHLRAPGTGTTGTSRRRCGSGWKCRSAPCSRSVSIRRASPAEHDAASSGLETR